MQHNSGEATTLARLREGTAEDVEVDPSEWLPVGARIRALTEEDAPAVARIAGQIGKLSSEEHWRDRLRAAVDSTWCRGIEVDGQLVAHVLAHMAGGELGGGDEETAWLEILGVDPAWQGRGLGRVLTELLFRDAAERGIERVVTVSGSRDESLYSFFRSLGFRQSRLVCLERRL